MADPAMLSNLSASSKSSLPSKLCITVVEDNESLCAVTVELLQQQGHRGQRGMRGERRLRLGQLRLDLGGHRGKHAQFTHLAEARR